MRRFLPEDFQGWTLSDSVQVYDRETIFDFINGAGEVYLSLYIVFDQLLSCGKEKRPSGSNRRSLSDVEIVLPWGHALSP